MEEPQQPRGDTGAERGPDHDPRRPSGAIAGAAEKGRALRLSLALNVGLVAFGLAFAAHRKWRGRGPSGPDVYLEERRSVHAALPARSGATVLLGDSLTERGPWAELLGDPSIQNRGISGDTTAGILARAPDIAAQQPARVLLLAGVNDLAAGESVPAIAARYGAILDVFRTAAPSARLYCEGVLPVRPPAAPATMRNDRIRELNEALRAVAAPRACTFVDLSPAVADESGALDARFTLDGVHLTGAGYAAWARAIAPLVNAPR